MYGMDVDVRISEKFLGHAEDGFRRWTFALSNVMFEPTHLFPHR